MMLSMAQAEISQAARDNLYGEWSDLLVGMQPDGLVACYLVEDDTHVRVMAVWADREAHDRAVEDESSHPAYRVFDAAGVDPHHTLMSVLGAVGGARLGG